MKLGELSWPDVAQLDKGRVVAVYPIASFEQHGPHLPFLTDTLEVTEIIERLDQRIPDNIVCLPTQWLGYSFHHMDFGGSLTATSDTHIGMIVETVSSLIAGGFLTTLIVNGHGGNRADMQVALQKLREHYREVRVYGVSWWEAAHSQLEQIREAGPRGWGHAGEMETSMVMVIRPDLVHTDRLQADGIWPESTYGDKVARFRMMRGEASHRGNIGDPTVATPEKGERMFQVVVDCLVGIVEDIMSGKL
ncbi:MAG: creatininase family protein [Candidatus Latescibacteria bacterium]|nr:creatininase family protein [Candidatus Latescibacterota bacterium]